MNKKNTTMRDDVVKIKVWEWHRYRHRNFKVFEDTPRDCKPVVICSKHRVQQSLCHCKETSSHLTVSHKLRIPPKHKKKEWDKLMIYLKEFGDYTEHFTYEKTVSKKQLTKNEKSLLLVGVQPKKSVYDLRKGMYGTKY
jgi:hypothetical protein